MKKNLLPLLASISVIGMGIYYLLSTRSKNEPISDHKQSGESHIREVMHKSKVLAI